MCYVPRVSLVRLQAVFIDALGLPAGTDCAGLTYRGVPEWTSIGHMALVAALESAFDVMLETDEVLALSSFRAAQGILGKHGVRFDAPG